MSSQKEKMRWYLFWTFLSIYAFTAVLTVLSVFFGVGQLEPSYKGTLINAVIVETVAAVVALFYQLFGITKSEPQTRTPTFSEAKEPIVGQEIVAIPTRQDYVKSVAEILDNASSKVTFCVNKLHTSEELPDAKKVNDALLKAKAAGANVQVLVADGTERLAGAYELAELLQLQVRMTRRLHFTELRFVRVDADLMVIGVSESVKLDRSYDSSDSWAKLRSKSLGEILDREFQSLWDEAEPFHQHAVKIIQEGLRTDKPDVVSEKLRLPLRFVQDCITQQ